MNDKVIHKNKIYGYWLRWTAVALITFILITILLIISGLCDPIPTETNNITIAPTTFAIAPKSQKIVWQHPVPSPPYSIKVTANLQSGEVDSGYGLLLGTDNDHFGVAIAPTGFLTVWQTGTQDTVFLPWQTWPHIQTGNIPNEIWLDMTIDGVLTLRVNREFLWSDEVHVPTGEVGLYAESFGETAVIHFQTK